jgi:putative nucleotidyltransferase with HDIG domain
VEFGALLHDIGKIAIPKSIINKPGPLDTDEWAVIKTHTLEGQKMLDRVGGFMKEVGLIVRSHHERWDGAGYPDGLAGDEIPLEARVIAAAIRGMRCAPIASTARRCPATPRSPSSMRGRPASSIRPSWRR